MYGMSKEKYKEWESEHEDWFQGVKKRIAEDKLQKSKLLQDYAHKASLASKKITFSQDLEVFLQRHKLENDENLSKVSSYTINDTNKKTAITDIASETSVVTESVSNEGESVNSLTNVASTSIISSSAVDNNSNDEVESDNESQYNSDIVEEEISSENFNIIISTNEINTAEDTTYLSSANNPEVLPNAVSNSTNDEKCSIKYTAADTKSHFASIVHVVTSKITSMLHSFTGIFHSKAESAEETVLNVTPLSNTFVDNCNTNNTDCKEVDCTGEAPLETGLLSVL